ncbi:MAG: sigma-70 family RNA polymerase sigma factor [Chitinophagaceae bacterium]|nr:sigma-70 family RNA polymerase sigma factor [Chitinophagaceae bacterium]
MQASTNIQGLKDGNPKMQQAFFARYARQQYATCRRYLASPQEAEEAMMSGMLKVFSQIGKAQLNSEAALQAWMRRIMINECLQKLRSQSSLLVLTEEVDADTGPATGAEYAVEAKEIFALLQQLPAGYRIVFNLYVVEGLTHRQISEWLQISEGASKSQLSKARKMLAFLYNKKMSYHGLGKAR